MLIVIRRGLTPSPSGAAHLVERRQQVVEVRQRLAHAHDDQVAEPFVGPQRCCRRSTCSTISPVVRFRSTPSSPLAQNTQPMPHIRPAC